MGTGLKHLFLFASGFLQGHPLPLIPSLGFAQECLLALDQLFQFLQLVQYMPVRFFYHPWKIGPLRSLFHPFHQPLLFPTDRLQLVPEGSHRLSPLSLRRCLLGVPQRLIKGLFPSLRTFVPDGIDQLSLILLATHDGCNEAPMLRIHTTFADSPEIAQPVCIPLDFLLQRKLFRDILHSPVVRRSHHDASVANGSMRLIDKRHTLLCFLQLGKCLGRFVKLDHVMGPLHQNGRYDVPKQGGLARSRRSVDRK